MRRGVVIGKFYPPHAGHRLLIETALQHVNHLDIIVCEHSSETIAGKLRARWLREMHPRARVHLMNWDGLDPDDSRLWAELTIQILGYRPDAVFTSEDYGNAYAGLMGAQHFLVDRERVTVPVSGVEVRAHPLAWWDYLGPPVRAYFARRVVVVGAESTGTTTLARDLAAHYQTCWVPEFGRLYYEAKMNTLEWSGWESEEFTSIARQQQALEDRLARVCNRLLVCDTDALATTIWHQRYIGTRSAAVDRLAAGRHYALYLVTGPDIPFVQDGTRDGEHVREWMHERFLEELWRRGRHSTVLSGGRDERLAQAVDAIDPLLV